MNIAVDAMGGDNAPLEIIKGAVHAALDHKDFTITLVGNESKILGLASENGIIIPSNIEIVHSESVVTMEDVLEPLVGKIPGLTHMEIRMAYQGGMDYALYSEFESRQALEDYAKHPLHLEAKSHFHHFIDTRVAADYEL